MMMTFGDLNKKVITRSALATPAVENCTLYPPSWIGWNKYASWYTNALFCALKWGVIL